MSERIRVVVKRVGCQPSIELVTPTLEALQAIVGGFIESCGSIQILTEAQRLVLTLYANDEPYQLPPNFQHPNGCVIVGDVVYVACDDRGNEVSIPEDHAQIIAAHVASYSPPTDREDRAS